MSQWVNYFLFFLFCSCATLVFSQTKEELQDKKEQLEREIQLTSELLGGAQKEKIQSINRLETLKRKIDARDEMIKTLDLELSTYSNHIETLKIRQSNIQDSISEKQKELKTLKDEYAKYIYHSYTNKDAYTRFAFIFSSQNFNQAYKRIKYFRQYSRFRKTQAQNIIAIEKKLKNTVLELKKTKALLSLEKNKKKNIISQTKGEKKQLYLEKEKKHEMITALKKKEKKLKQELRFKEEETSALQKQIKSIIEEEIKLARELAKKTGAPLFSATPEQMELSKSFMSNKGRLPWPVEKGVLLEFFGRQKHPVLAGVETFNNGVKITTEKGSFARSIFEGEVSRVIKIPGAGKAIIIKHGEYFSVYSNLLEVFVKPGDFVDTKKKLGSTITNQETQETIVELQIWKGSQKLDPSQWLYRAY